MLRFIAAIRNRGSFWIRLQYRKFLKVDNYASTLEVHANLKAHFHCR